MKLKNFGISWLTALTILPFVINCGWCATYYVKNSGNDGASGLTPEMAWSTIYKVNSYNFSKGDTVCFKRGDMFDDKTLGSPGVDDFTIRDYGPLEEPKPVFDGNAIQPIRIDDQINNLIVMNIDISGQNWLQTKGPNIRIRNVTGVTIDGVVGNGHAGNTTSAGKTAIHITNCWGDIEISNCHLYKWGPPVIPRPTGDFMGIAVSDISSGSIRVHDNIVHDVNADCIYFKNCTPEVANVYNNTLYNAGENSIDCKGIQNLNIYSNEMYRGNDFTGWGGNKGHLEPLVIIHYVPVTETQDGKPGLASKNLNIYENYFHDLTIGQAIRGACHSGDWIENVHIYRNKFSNIKGGIWLYGNITGSIYYNLFMNPIRFESSYGDAGGIFCNSSTISIKIYNNVIWSTNGNLETGINLESTGPGTEVKNNIVCLDKANATEYPFRCPCYLNTPDVDNNCWYNKSSEKRVKFGRHLYTTSNFASWKLSHIGEQSGDPKLTTNFRLASDSPCIDTGADLCLTEDFVRAPVPFAAGVDIGGFERRTISEPKVLRLVKTPLAR